MTNNSTITVTRNVRNTVTGQRGAVIRIKGDTATVLDRDTGKLVGMMLAVLVPTKGRPVKLVNGLHRADVDALISENPAFRVAAVREMFGRQTDDERQALATRWDNKVGFRADDARRGSTLAGKAACAWTPEDHATARYILGAYSGTQLWDLASVFLGEDNQGALGLSAEATSEEIADAAMWAGILANGQPSEVECLISEIVSE